MGHSKGRQPKGHERPYHIPRRDTRSPADATPAFHAWAREAAARHPAFRGIAWATADGARLVVTQATPRTAVLAVGDDVLADP